MLFNQIPGITLNRTFADIVTVGGLILILMATATVWIRQWASTNVSPNNADVMGGDSPAQTHE
jgi:hypothetical protein